MAKLKEEYEQFLNDIEQNVKNKEEILNSSSFLIKEPKQYYGTWSSYFGNSNPIHIEIGM